MARVVQPAASASPAIFVPQSAKARFRPRLPSNTSVERSGPGAQVFDALVKVGKGHSINTPRKIRSRIANPRASRPKPLITDTEGCVNHEVVISPTGRVAMGPWTGPFETCEVISETPFFIDPHGIAHTSLTMEEVQETPKRTPTPSLVDMAVETVKKNHFEEVKRAHARFSRLAGGVPTKRNARAAARMNKVHQPRRQY